LLTAGEIYRESNWVSCYLHAHDGEYKDNDGQHEAEVAERAQRSTNDVDQ